MLTGYIEAFIATAGAPRPEPSTAALQQETASTAAAAAPAQPSAPMAISSGTSSSSAGPVYTIDSSVKKTQTKELADGVRELKALFNEGVLSEAEFADAKKAFIASLAK